MSTPPTSIPWVPIFDTRPKLVIPTPVNGKWAKGVGGALVWQDIPGFVTPDTNWRIIGPGGAIPLENGWTVWNDANYNPPRWRKTLDGLVLIEGLLNASGTANTTAFTLPVGYRPAPQAGGGNRIKHFYTPRSWQPGWGSFWVAADGTVKVEGSAPGNWISLNQIRFWAGG